MNATLTSNTSPAAQPGASSPSGQQLRRRKGPGRPVPLLGWLLSALSAVACLAGAAAARAGTAAKRMAAVAKAVPRSAYPPLQYVYIGRQVYLPRRAAMHHRSPRAPPGENDELVPLHAPRHSPLTPHRMISYRARMLELHSQH
jgi:hypothetical protein